MALAGKFEHEDRRAADHHDRHPALRNLHVDALPLHDGTRHGRPAPPDDPPRRGDGADLRAAGRRHGGRPAARSRWPRAPGCSTCPASSAAASGIAITATLLTHFTEQARDALRPHLGITDGLPRQWMAGMEQMFLRQGGTPAEAMLKAQAVPRRPGAPTGVGHRLREGVPDDGDHLPAGAPPPVALPDRQGRRWRGAGALAATGRRSAVA